MWVRARATGEGKGANAVGLSRKHYGEGDAGGGTEPQAARKDASRMGEEGVQEMSSSEGTNESERPVWKSRKRRVTRGVSRRKLARGASSVMGRKRRMGGARSWKRMRPLIKDARIKPDRGK